MLLKFLEFLCGMLEIFKEYTLLFKFNPFPSPLYALCSFISPLSLFNLRLKLVFRNLDENPDENT